MPKEGSRDPCRRSVAFVFAEPGSGLYPLTRDREKLTVPFGGEYRMIDFVLSNCLNSGLRRIRVFVRRRSVELDRHLQMGWKVFSGELGEFLDVVPAPGAGAGEHGAGATVLRNLQVLERGDTDTVCVLFGDHICRMDYGDLLRAHRARDADLTVACRSLPGRRHSFGVVDVADGGRVVGVACADPGGAKGGTLRLAPMGAYVFGKEALLRLARELHSDDGLDLLRDVVPAVARGGRAFAWTPADPSGDGSGSYWCDVRTVDSYYAANADLVGESPALDLYDVGWPVRTHREQRPPTRLVSGEGAGEAQRCLVAAGCLISGGRAEGSILFPRVRLRDGSRVTDSILMAGVTVSAGAVVRKAIIDEGVVVRAGERIGVDPERDRRRFTVSPGGVVVVPRETRPC